jgi:uncharacterized protein YbaP (TraB family)
MPASPFARFLAACAAGLRRVAAAFLAAALLAPAAAQTPPPGPALWVVRDGAATVHLFGTVHVLPPGLGWLAGDVRAAFERSDALVLEMVVPPPEQAQGLVLRHALAPGALPVAARLPPPARDAYAAALAALDLPADAFDPFQTWFAATALAAGAAERAGLAVANGPEAVLSAAAAAAGKPVSGLETFEEQLALFATMPEPLQVRFLASTAEQMPQAAAVLATTVDAWSRGDTDAVATVLAESLRDLPEANELLMANRNARWAAWIRERLRTPGTVFLAVGAGHLAGPGSVLERLESLGVRPERVRTAP